jgi:hypothetical protein
MVTDINKVAIELKGTALGPYPIQSSSNTNKLLSLSHVPMTGISDKHVPIVDTCHIMGIVHLYICWPLVHFPPTVGESDTSQSNYQCNGNTTLVVFSSAPCTIHISCNNILHTLCHILACHFPLSACQKFLPFKLHNQNTIITLIQIP